MGSRVLFKNMSYVDISDAAAHACPYFIQNCDVSLHGVRDFESYQ